MNLNILERYLRVNLLGPGPSSYKKIIYRAAVSQRLGNTAVENSLWKRLCIRRKTDQHVLVLLSCLLRDQNFLNTYSNTIGHNRHTLVVVSVVQNFIQSL
jgi:hypothetical protein